MVTDKIDAEEGLSPGQRRVQSDLRKFNENADKLLLRNEVISAAESRVSGGRAQLHS